MAIMHHGFVSRVLKRVSLIKAISISRQVILHQAVMIPALFLCIIKHTAVNYLNYKSTSDGACYLHGQLFGMHQKWTNRSGARPRLVPPLSAALLQHQANTKEARWCGEFVVYAGHPCWEHKRHLASFSNSLLDTNIRLSVGYALRCFYKYSCNTQISLFAVSCALAWRVYLRLTEEELILVCSYFRHVLSLGLVDL